MQPDIALCFSRFAKVMHMCSSAVSVAVHSMLGPQTSVLMQNHAEIMPAVSFHYDMEKCTYKKESQCMADLLSACIIMVTRLG